MFFILLFIIGVLFIILNSMNKRSSKKKPPGPISWPIISNILILRKLTREYGGQHLAFLELSRRYKSDVIRLQLGASSVVVVNGVKHITKVLNCSDFDGRPWSEFIKLRNLGIRKGITMNDGPIWKEMRRWLVRTFRNVGIGNQVMADLFKDELLQILHDMNDKKECNIKPIITPAVINVLWTLTTGKRFADKKGLQYFVELMDRRTRAFDMTGGLLTICPWIRYLLPDFTGYNILLLLNQELKNFLMETIEDHKKKYKPGCENDLIDKFLQEMYSDESANFDDDQLLLILMDLFIAGVNTTATTLDFIFINMVVHQDAQQRVHDEIDTIIGRDRMPSLNDRPNLPFIEAVLTESQRMWTVTPIIGPRRVLQDSEIGEFSIPEDSTVLLNIYSVNHDENLYPDPHLFKPERFIKDGIYQSDENIVLFGKGKRRCPGEVLAKAALFILFVGIMQKYKLQSVPGEGPTSVTIIPGLTISPKPYKIVVVPR